MNEEIAAGSRPRIVIAGGGAAGWITAGYLQAQLDPQAGAPEIIVIESDTIGRLGVGEATVPTLRRTIEVLGISEHEFMRFTHATFKHGIRFEDWVRPGHAYFHSFEAFEDKLPIDEVAAWLRRRAGEGARPFAYELGIQAYIADAELSPKPFADGRHPMGLNYAYHVDAVLLGDFLRMKLVERGVRHVSDTVVDVTLEAETGRIASLKLESGECVTGDFFVDCTGFSSRLLGQALGTPFVSYANHLLCNAAIVAQMPHAASDRQPKPYTTAKAASAGWIWDIGLQHRKGRGYVFSTGFIDADAAEQEFRHETGLPDDQQARLLRFEPGRRASSWTGNCVAIGLSAGFLEPLESTGIMLIEEGARMLARLLPLEPTDVRAPKLYNDYMAGLYDEIRDFLVMHYCLTQRQDTDFWREVAKPERIPERLSELLELWQFRLPAEEELGPRFTFSLTSWQAVFFGMESMSKAAVERTPLHPVMAYNLGREARRAELLGSLPGHNEYLAMLAREAT